MKLTTLIILSLIGGALCYSDWSDVLMNEHDEFNFDEYPILRDYAEAFSSFYKGILRVPKGLKFVDTCADVLDLTLTHPYNWTLIDMYLYNHDLPGVEYLMTSFMAALPEGKRDPLLEYQMNQIKYLLKTDREFVGLIAREITPVITSSEMEDLVHLMKDPAILSELIDLLVSVVKISTDFAVDFLLNLKEGLSDKRSASDFTISNVFESLRDYENEL